MFCTFGLFHLCVVNLYVEDKNVRKCLECMIELFHSSIQGISPVLVASRQVDRLNSPYRHPRSIVAPLTCIPSPPGLTCSKVGHKGECTTLLRKTVFTSLERGRDKRCHRFARQIWIQTAWESFASGKGLTNLFVAEINEKWKWLLTSFSAPSTAY